ELARALVVVLGELEAVLFVVRFVRGALGLVGRHCGLGLIRLLLLGLIRLLGHGAEVLGQPARSLALTVSRGGGVVERDARRVLLALAVLLLVGLVVHRAPSVESCCGRPVTKSISVLR